MPWLAEVSGISTFWQYRHLPALREYILISQDMQQVEVYRRQGGVGWLASPMNRATRWKSPALAWRCRLLVVCGYRCGLIDG